MDNQRITQRPLFYLENLGTSHWVERGCTESINGFGGQSDEFSAGKKLSGWLKALGSSENPGLQASNSLSSAS